MKLRTLKKRASRLQRDKYLHQQQSKDSHLYHEPWMYWQRMMKIRIPRQLFGELQCKHFTYYYMPGEI